MEPYVVDQSPKRYVFSLCPNVVSEGLLSSYRAAGKSWMLSTVELTAPYLDMHNAEHRCPISALLAVACTSSIETISEYFRCHFLLERRVSVDSRTDACVEQARQRVQLKCLWSDNTLNTRTRISSRIIHP